MRSEDEQSVEPHESDSARRPNLFDRGVAAIIAGLAFAVPVPLVVLLITRPIVELGDFVQEGAAFWLGVPIWFAIAFVLGLLVGGALGTRRLVELLAHFLGTAQPPRPAVTMGLWMTLGIVVVISYFGVTHAL